MLTLKRHYISETHKQDIDIHKTIAGDSSLTGVLFQQIYIWLLLGSLLANIQGVP